MTDTLCRGSLWQLAFEAEQAEENARALRAEMKLLFQKEQADLNDDILDALETWRNALPSPLRKADLPRMFRNWAAIIRSTGTLRAEREAPNEEGNARDTADSVLAEATTLPGASDA